jgi:hypothetical protein
MQSVRGPSSDGVSAVDEDGRFMSGPAIVIIFEDVRPICRRFEFPLMRIMVLLP